MIAIALPKWKPDLVTYLMLSSSYYPCKTGWGATIAGSVRE
jgi:hypothetical protein